MAAYTTSDQLLIGSGFNLSDLQDPVLYVAQAGDEIDSRLGFLYQVPFDISDSSSLSLASRLLIKRINIHLATGRAILATLAAAESSELNAYGQQMVDSALSAIQAILDGKIILNGAKYLNGTTASVATGQSLSSPLIADINLTGSGFDAFYSGYMGSRYPYGRKIVTFDE